MFNLIPLRNRLKDKNVKGIDSYEKELALQKRELKINLDNATVKLNNSVSFKVKMLLAKIKSLKQDGKNKVELLNSRYKMNVKVADDKFETLINKNKEAIRRIELLNEADYAYLNGLKQPKKKTLLEE